MKSFAVLALSTAIAMAGCASESVQPPPIDETKSTFSEPIASFEACLISGQPIMESHPRQCAYEDLVFVEDIETGNKGDTKLILFEIGPEISRCQGAFPQECMIVNGGLFYDSIEGFTHTPGTTHIIEVLRTQYCDPDEINSCPQDVGIYNYKIVRVISEMPAP